MGGGVAVGNDDLAMLNYSASAEALKVLRPPFWVLDTSNEGGL